MVFGFDEVNKEEKDGNSHYFNKKILDKDDLDEVNKISEMLNQDEKVLLVARQSKLKPGGSYFTPNTIYATDRRIIIRDPYMLGIKSNVVDIPYDVITSLKLEKGLLSSTIKFEAPGLMNSTKLGIADSIVKGENDQEGIIEAIPKDKAEDLIEIIRSGMEARISRSLPSKKQKYDNNSDKPRDSTSNKSASLTDELLKLAKMREEGIINEKEFNQIKQKLIT